MSYPRHLGSLGPNNSPNLNAHQVCTVPGTVPVPGTVSYLVYLVVRPVPGTVFRKSLSTLLLVLTHSPTRSYIYIRSALK